MGAFDMEAMARRFGFRDWPELERAIYSGADVRGKDARFNAFLTWLNEDCTIAGASLILGEERGNRYGERILERRRV